MGLRSINIFNFINPHYSAINNHKPSCKRKRGFKSVVFFPKHALFHKTNIPFSKLHHANIMFKLMYISVLKYYLTIVV